MGNYLDILMFIHFYYKHKFIPPMFIPIEKEGYFKLQIGGINRIQNAIYYSNKKNREYEN